MISIKKPVGLNLPMNSAEDQEENHLAEYSGESDSSHFHIDLDDQSENALTFLRTTRSG